MLQHGGFGPTVWDGALPRPTGAALAVIAATVALGLSLWRFGRSGTPRPESAAAPPTRWVLITVAGAAAAIHLALASLPMTEGADARARVLAERAFAHELLDQPAAARRARRAHRRAVQGR